MVYRIVLEIFLQRIPRGKILGPPLVRTWAWKVVQFRRRAEQQQEGDAATDYNNVGFNPQI